MSFAKTLPIAFVAAYMACEFCGYLRMCGTASSDDIKIFFFARFFARKHINTHPLRARKQDRGLLAVPVDKCSAKTEKKHNTQKPRRQKSHTVSPTQRSAQRREAKHPRRLSKTHGKCIKCTPECDSNHSVDSVKTQRRLSQNTAPTQPKHSPPCVRWGSRWST